MGSPGAGRPRAVLLSAWFVLVAQVAVTVLGAWARPDLFDQGTYLATARFVADGLVPYRDFNHPYGPGLSYLDAVLVWLDLDTLAAHRLLWGVGSIALTAVVLVAARRAGRLGWGVVLAALLLVGPIRPTYVVPVLCVAVAVAVLLRNQSRMAWALGLLAVAVWFRFEYALLLAMVALAWIIAARGSRIRAIAVSGIAGFAAAAPYVVLVALGALPGLRITIDYALNDFPEHRGLPYPWSAPLEAARRLVSGNVFSAIDYAVRIIGYLIGPVVVLAVVLLLVRGARRGATPLREVLSPPAVRLALLFFLFCLYSLRVRADAFHAAPMVLATGLVLVCLGVGVDRRPRALQTAPVAVAAVLAALAVWRGVAGVDDRDPLLDQAVAEARQYVQPGDAVFVANRDNTTTYINAPYFYWALEARPASPVTSFDPGYADQPAVQDGIVADLCAVQPVVVLWDAPSGSGAGDDGSDVLDRFLATSYRQVAGNAEFEVLAYAGGC